MAALLVDLPPAPARSRAALLAFAVEERLGVPLDDVVVAPARLTDSSAPPTTQLALVASRQALAEAEALAAPGAALLPEFLAIRRPEAAGGLPAWAAWRDGARVIVRRSDGTGFAAAADALPALWARAGRPRLLSLGAALPVGLPATDLSAAPPAPDPLDLAFSFRREGASSGDVGRPLMAAAAIAGVAALLHLALAAADTVALGRIAADERARAEAALAPILPGVGMDAGLEAVLARLAPASPLATRSDFLPLLADASAAVAAAGRDVTFRRLAWGAEDGTLALLVQGSRLDDLQAVEQALAAAGLSVASGAASAGDGGAEVEMQVARGVAG